MGSNMNFNGLGMGGDGGGGGGGRPPGGNYPLARQTSVYALTFEEFQNSIGGLGKDFGSMNMDELLKSIWSAEETQNLVGSSGGGGGLEGLGMSSGHLQRQGSLTLPRTLSQKTVDEVWRDMSKEFGVGKDGSGVGGSSMPQRQPTLGEVTLEEFLVRAGVVREDNELIAKPNNNTNGNNTGFFGDLSRGGNQSGLDFGGFQQSGRNTVVMGGKIPESSNQMATQSPNLPLNVNGARSSQQQIGTAQAQQHQHQQLPQSLFPKQPTLAPYPMAIPSSGGLGSPGLRGGIVGISDPTMNNNLVQNAALQGGVGMVGLGAGGVTVASGSPSVTSDGMGKSNGEMSSVSPVPYVFNGGLRGRKSGALEKVVERRQRRMIKNRESAARSRARKQAYTMELEAEVAQLKEENEKLRKKQAEIMEMQKNQVEEMMNNEPGAKRRCLRRTQTSPW